MESILLMNFVNVNDVISENQSKFENNSSYCIVSYSSR